MKNEHGCRDARFAFLFVLAVLGLVIWMVVRFTGQAHVEVTDKT